MRLMNVAKKYGRKLARPAVPVLGMLALPAFATGTDYSALTGAADWTTVALGVITILAAFGLVKVAIKGGKALLAML